MPTPLALTAQTSPLLAQLLDLPEVEVRSLALEHGLCGFLSHLNVYFAEKETQDLFLQIHQRQLLRNIFFLDEFQKLNASLEKKEGLFFTPLKGLSLLKTIHNIGDRPMTDMDVYTQLPPESFIPFLQAEGYLLKKEKKWHFTQHKWLFHKTTNIMELSLEVHTQLLPQDRHWSWQIHKDGRLKNDEEFLYLVAHWAQQHTCLKLFWLFDLYFYVKKYQIEFNKNLFEKAKKLQVHQSLCAAIYALRQCFQLDVNSPPKRQLLLSHFMRSENLLFLPKNRLQYLLLKHLLKESALDSFLYDALWLRDRIENHLFKYKKIFDRNL